MPFAGGWHSPHNHLVGPQAEGSEQSDRKHADVHNGYVVVCFCISLIQFAENSSVTGVASPCNPSPRYAQKIYIENKAS